MAMEPVNVAVSKLHTNTLPLWTYPTLALRWRDCHLVLAGRQFADGHGFQAHDVRVEFFWRARPYNVVAGYDGATGDLRGYYCNVILPPAWTHGDGARRVTYADLDLDLWVVPDGTQTLLDEDEFAENAARYAYAPEVVADAWGTVNEIRSRVERRAHPFRFESLPALLARLCLPDPRAAIRHLAP